MTKRIGAFEQRFEEVLQLIRNRDGILSGMAGAADRLRNALRAVIERDPQDDVLAGALGERRETDRLLVRQLEAKCFDLYDLEIAGQFEIGRRFWIDRSVGSCLVHGVDVPPRNRSNVMRFAGPCGADCVTPTNGVASVNHFSCAGRPQGGIIRASAGSQRTGATSRSIA